jgi:hypothetical protein
MVATFEVELCREAAIFNEKADYKRVQRKALFCGFLRWDACDFGWDASTCPVNSCSDGGKVVYTEVST